MRTTWTPKKEQRFLDLLSDGHTVKHAVETAGLSRSQAYDLRREQPEFAAAWDAAIIEGAEALEQEAFRRAVEGTDKPIVHLGVVTDTVKEYSDTLLIFLLKGRLPDKYKDRVQADTTHSGDVRILVEYANADDPA